MYMKQNNFWIGLALAISLLGSSCTKELEKLNENPNSPSVVDPEYLLNTSIFNTMNFFGGDMRRRVLSHYSNYVSGVLLTFNVCSHCIRSSGILVINLPMPTG